MERWLKSACTPIESRPTRLWQQTGVSYSCYPSPADFIPPLLREELRRKDSRRSSATSERMGLWYLNDHNAQPVRVSYLHLPQPPRLVCRELDNVHSGLFQLVSYSVDVSHLQPQTYTLAGPSG